MNRMALLAVGVAGLTALAGAPAEATEATATAQTVTSCGYSGLQAGLSTRLCADVTDGVVEFYGKVGLAGPPSPGSPAPAPKELFTTLSAEVVGSGIAPVTQDRPVRFIATPLEVHGVVTTAACGSTVRGTFGVASFPWSARPVVHEVTITC
ncbi:hypothetical protein [Streptomyces sp. NPDC093225]|uniref:hypothetical protein n=1 Tax=Streptomyces sp. NPDC093225 TaxID=3366034 RepID=UPI003809FA36